MEILKDFIYFKKDDKIEVLKIPRFGNVTIKSQDGIIVTSEITESRRY